MPVTKRSPEQAIGNLATVGEFWQWAMSDLLDNANRGVFAEFIVGKLLGLDLQGVRTEWDAYDLLYRDYKLEVKSSAYIQTWHSNDQKRSTPKFGIGKRWGWDAQTNTSASTPQRSAHVYIFCLFPAEPEVAQVATAHEDVLNLDLWAFYVSLSKNLPEDGKTIGISTLKQLCGEPVGHAQLKQRVDELLATLSQG